MKKPKQHLLFIAFLLLSISSQAQPYQLVLTNTQNDKTKVLEEGDNVAFNLVGRTGMFMTGKPPLWRKSSSGGKEPGETCD